MQTILFVSGFFCDTYSSIEDMSVELSKELSSDYRVIWLVPSIDNPNNCFKDICNREKLPEPLYVSELRKNNIDFVVGNISKFNIFANILLFRNIFKKYNIDAVYTQFGFERFYSALIGKMFRKKVIWQEHWFSLGTGFKHIHIKKLFHKLLVDDFIAVSNHIGSTINSKKVHVVQNAKVIKDVHITPGLKAEYKAALGLDRFKTVVIMIAAFRQMKRYDFAFDIVNKIREKSKETGFVFLGDGEEFEYYKELAKQMNITDSIVLAGHTLEIDKYLTASDIFMLTSLYGEGLPLCLLEAMNFKLPIVTFDMPWVHEVIVDNWNGCLIEPENTGKFADVLYELANSPQKRESLGDNSYNQLINNFSIPIWRKKMKQVFDNILS